MLRRLSVLLVLLVLAGTTQVSRADVSQKGTVVRIADGDTVDVDVWGDGTTKPVTIRNAGLQAMELGECHADAAKAAMSAAAMGKTVQLTSATSNTLSLGRPVRFVDAVDGTTSVDTQLEVLRRGLALWLTIYPETWRTATYHRAMEEAASKRIGMWDDDACGYGPAQAARLKIWVNYDGDGDENLYPNNEWVEVLNQGTDTVSLAGWWVRSAAQDSFVFPAGTSLAPGKVLKLRIGKGTSTSSTFYWGNSVARFPNLTATARIGSGVYLFDPDGDVRTHATYPCIYGSCTAAAAGKVRIQANYDAPGDDATNPNGEYVTVTSLSSTPVDLSWHVVQVGGSTRELGEKTVLPTLGSTLRVYVGSGTSTRLVKYWGRSGGIMPNAGGAAELRTSESVRVACTSWGTGAC
jgi:endonuclease YncB( thermonuclease family)